VDGAGQPGGLDGLPAPAVPQQIGGDAQQQGLRVTDVAGRIGRQPDIGLLNQIGGLVGADMAAQTSPEPVRITPVKLIKACRPRPSALSCIGHNLRSSEPAKERLPPEAAGESPGARQ